MDSSKRQRGEKPRRAGAKPLGAVDGGPKALYELVGAYLIAASTLSEAERALIRGKMRARDVQGLLKAVESLSAEHLDLPRFREVTQLAALVKKYPFTSGESAIDTRRVAINGFKSVEWRMKRVNVAMALRRRGIQPNARPRSPEARPRHVLALDMIRRQMLHIFGEKPNMSRIYDKCDFTGGAAIGVSGNLTNWGRKALADRWTCSRSAFPYACAALYRNRHIQELLAPRRFSCENDLTGQFGEAVVLSWQTAAEDLDYQHFRALVAENTAWVDHNKIAFVPKTAKTDRSIAVEPLLNGYLQKGIDLELRSLLKRRIGIDLSSQAHNQEAARLGSLLGTNDPWVTIDLSSASDSLSRELCRLVLPEEWYRLLDDCRVHRYELDGRVTSYEKFVSMGNGFCFPLQTALFSAVCIAAIEESLPHGSQWPRAPRDFLVYGDDIIVRQSVALRVIELLSMLGFRTNRDKTFITGPFRESCGADWVNGQAVRPVYVKNRLESAMDFYAFHNTARRIAGHSGDFGLTPEFLRHVRTMLPPRLQLMRPFAGPDTAFEVCLDEAMCCPSVRWSRSRQCWSWVELIQTTVEDLGPTSSKFPWSVVAYIAKLRSASPGVALAVRRKTRSRFARRANWGLGSLSPVQDRLNRLMGC